MAGLSFFGFSGRPLKTICCVAQHIVGMLLVVTKQWTVSQIERWDNSVETRSRLRPAAAGSRRGLGRSQPKSPGRAKA
jgi:hypothetical protein